uniref:TetR/AcrR family transcriptional regulator n=1 Tax=Plantactinospora solaniradicis TaxID=1723736 RepID=UPI003670C785
MEVAAGLLAAEGPRSLSARRLGKELGTSSTTVYTHFGGMPELVREVMREGFRRLGAELASVSRSDDPVADVVGLILAYRRAAHGAPHLYRVMFGGSEVAGFELTDDDRRIGRRTLAVARDTIQRCTQAGRFRPVEPRILAHQLWCQVHGLVSLELAGYRPADPDDHGDLRHYWRSFAVGAGDTTERAAASVQSALANRIAAE